MNSCFILCVIACCAVQLSALPIEQQEQHEHQQQQQQYQVAVPLPAVLTHADLPSADSPNESVVAAVPLSLLDVEPATAAVSNDDASQRSARGLGFGGLGGLGKFGGLGLGFKGFGGWGLGGGLHGFGGGLHGLGGLGGFKHWFG